MKLGFAAELSNVSKSYGGKVVLSNVNLRVDAGELFAVLGPSGSGKSTLLRILNLLEPPDKGRVTFTNSLAEPQDHERLRRKMTLLLQRPVMFKDSVYNNIAYGLRLRGMSEESVRSRVLNALKEMGLEGFERRKANTLSGGEAQRVAFARAIAIEPELLLLDEFTANLDPTNIKMLESALLQYWSRTKCTVVLVSHNPFQAARLAKRCLFLYQGDVLATGDIDAVHASNDDERIGAFFRGDLI